MGDQRSHLWRAGIARRLDVLALEQLRTVAAAQSIEIERLREQLAEAEDAGNWWRDQAIDSQRELIERVGGAPGLTVDGRLIVIQEQKSME